MVKAIGAEHPLEVPHKLEQMRQWLLACDAGAILLRGSDWFSWATAGGSNIVLLTAETGVAEILVTANTAYLMTDEIEAERIRQEEVGADWLFHINPWAEPEQRRQFVRDMAGGRPVFSDRPADGERPLPAAMRQERLVLGPAEQNRYRKLGLEAAKAMTEVLRAARPNWTEYRLAGAGAAALWERGIHPALVLAAGAARLPRYRHATPSGTPLGQRAMLVFCARRHGLYANLTRFVSFGAAPERQQEIMAVEASGLDACIPGQPLNAVYRALQRAYREHGFPEAIREHHQGGITGYLAREILATPDATLSLEAGMALALNPSFSGIKMEDTFLIGKHGLENLTLDPAWPAATVQGRLRPLWLEVS
jgi:Xaa-Pro aminopeptidase